MLKKALVANHN